MQQGQRHITGAQREHKSHAQGGCEGAKRTSRGELVLIRGLPGSGKSTRHLAISGWTYVMYMHDKTAAELGEWRVSEGGLHLLGLLGGWPGANLAQHFLRHKSKKASFRVKHWVMVSLNLGAFAFMASNGMLRLEYWL